MSRIFFATICFIIYGSLYPFQFHARRVPARPVGIWVQGGPAQYLEGNQIKDVVVNVLLYAPLGMFGFLSLSGRRRKTVALMGPIAIGFLLSCSMELLQMFDAGRDAGAMDLLSNTAGSAAGVLWGMAFERSLRRIETGLQTIHYQQASSLLLLFCFAAYQLFPFFPDYSPYRLEHKVADLLAMNHFSVTIFLVSLIEWLTIGRLAETAIAPGWVSRIYLALLLLVPAEMLIIGRTMDVAEISGAAAGFLIWRQGLRHWARRSVLLAVLFTAVIIFRGLAPYHFANVAAPFSWVPFGAMFQSNRLEAMSVVLRKMFAYGTFIWLLRDSGWRMRYAAEGAAATLAAIEVAQKYLPGRTPEISDPVLALIMAWVLFLLDRPAQDAPVDAPVRTESPML